MAETGKIERGEKKYYVIDLLIDKGYTITDEVEAFIESAVKELDMAVDAGFAEIVDEFETVDDECESECDSEEVQG